jgi:hypothetical protein
MEGGNLKQPQSWGKSVINFFGDSNWQKFWDFLNHKWTDVLKILNLLALAVAIAALAYENLVPAIHHIFPGISIPIPPWFTNIGLVTVFGTLAITAGINALLALGKCICFIKNKKVPSFDFFSALCAVLDSTTICVVASFMAFGVAINPAIIPPLFIAALTYMALGAVFDFIAKKERNEIDTREKVKLGLTIALSTFGIVALAVQLTSIVTAGALVTIPVSWALAGILALIVIGFIISKLVGSNRAHNETNSSSNKPTLDNTNQQIAIIASKTPSQPRYSSPSCTDQLYKDIVDSTNFNDLKNIFMTKIDFFYINTLEDYIDKGLLYENRGKIKEEIINFNLPQKMSDLLLQKFDAIKQDDHDGIFSIMKTLHDVLRHFKKLNKDMSCIQNYNTSSQTNNKTHTNH